MELNQLVYFEAVARHLHFTRAAEELHVAQPSVSQQIRKLEQELGTPLFSRAKRQVKLTRAGQRFLPHVQHVLETLEIARADAQGRPIPHHLSEPVPADTASTAPRPVSAELAAVAPEQEPAPEPTNKDQDADQPTDPAPRGRFARFARTQDLEALT